MSRPIQNSGKQNSRSTTNVTQPAAEILLRTIGGVVVWQNGQRYCGMIGGAYGYPGTPGGLIGRFW